MKNDFLSKYLGRDRGASFEKRFTVLTSCRSEAPQVARCAPLDGILPGAASLRLGHFVLIDQASKLAGDYYVCVCDPWDSEVRSQEILPGQTVRYSANYPKITKQGHEYAAAPNSRVLTKWTVEIGIPAHCSLS